MAVLCCRMFHQQRRVTGGRDSCFGGAEQGFVCLSLHACAVFAVCLACQLSAVTPAIIECDSAVAMFVKGRRRREEEKVSGCLL